MGDNFYVGYSFKPNKVVNIPLSYMSYGSDFDTHVNVSFMSDTELLISFPKKSPLFMSSFSLHACMAKHAAKIYPTKSFIDGLSSRIYMYMGNI